MKNRIIYVCINESGGWVRFFDRFGLSWTSIPSFSTRIGKRKAFKIGRYYFQTLKK